MMNYSEIDEFKKEFKHFYKKYSSLVDDFKIFKLVLNVEPCLINKHCEVVYSENNIKILKKRIQCRTLRDSLRIIYSYQENKELIEFIELYRHTDNKTDYNRERIKEYFKNGL